MPRHGLPQVLLGTRRDLEMLIPPARRDGLWRPWMAIALVIALGAANAAATPPIALPFRAATSDFAASREVLVNPAKSARVVVTDFFHHGQINPRGDNVVVVTRDQHLVASRVLQLGPGDYCRLAFETSAAQTVYTVLYGGEAPRRDLLPAWTYSGGLLLETRPFRACDLDRLESVREAFWASPPTGSDYVDTMRRAGNPFNPLPEPFLSRYSGSLEVEKPGTYGLFTSSQDASFLTVDGRMVAAAPGRHGPAREATPANRHEVYLSKGTHRFEFYHAAAGADAVMSAAWELPPLGVKPQPKAIPPEAFGAQHICHEPSGPVAFRNGQPSPDFLAFVQSALTVPDSDQPMVWVRFIDRSPRRLQAGSRYRWQFGDGQESADREPTHVYLRPGTYVVRLTILQDAKQYRIGNRVCFDPPPNDPVGPKLTLLDCLPILATYDPHRLDGPAMKQLILACQAMAESRPAASAVQGPNQANRRPLPGSSAIGAQPGQADHKADEAWRKLFLGSAVRAGKVAFLESTAVSGDEHLWELVRLAGPLARDELADSRLALQIWCGAAQRIHRDLWKLDCQLEAADIALNDLGDRRTGQRLLDDAGTRLAGKALSPELRHFQRLRGDSLALAGDGDGARRAYRQAAAITSGLGPTVQEIARQGAYCIAVEQYLRAGEPVRAAGALHAWQDGFPDNKIDGSWTLLAVQYWIARQQLAPAKVQAEQLRTINPASAYADQVFFSIGEAEAAAGDTASAMADLRVVVQDYPASPLLPASRQKIASLEVRRTRQGADRKPSDR